ncbi:formate dehydrogenase subunit gamma [Mycoplana sp. BE70]|uniref:formate dehydrogenase subunit gamma n=1 Tax=Mycoplana sp. BE70 TaxID=2817775 RepID=UPI002864D35D|nr:formate dehydrogenase subunit gamma [Mycoplana sp. BE70]MDR6756930.1 formate dehydrogenase subunit gamma [Mycoplana sp. BE70]
MSKVDYDVERGDSIIPGRPVRVHRYSGGARVNHWITAISLVLLGLSGLAMFHPALFFLSGLFGGGQWTRTIHPWIGVVLFFSFLGLFLRFWSANLWQRVDTQWVAQANDVLAGNEEKLPEVGKYNAGQKVVFWSMSILIVVLIASGMIIWQQYFGAYTTIEQQRWGLLVHSVAAVVAICVWIVHVYAAIWVRGTISAMTRGTVTGGWAWRHHRKWLRELVSRNRHGPSGTTPAE